MDAKISFCFLLLIVPTNDGSILSDKVANAVGKITHLAKIISFDSIQEITIHIFNMLRAIRDLDCNISELMKGMILL